MTETELQTAVIDTAHLLGWRVAHFRPALTAKGWRTPVEADGAGFPDLVLVRRRPVSSTAKPGRVLFVELKDAKNKLSDAQAAWGDDLAAVAERPSNVDVLDYHVWRPADWTSGRIERVLRG